MWEIGYDKGAHPNPVLAGYTLYAASRVIEKQEGDEQTGIARFKLVGVKNETPTRLIERGIDLFEGKSDQKVFEIERAMLLPKEFVADQTAIVRLPLHSIPSDQPCRSDSAAI